MNLTDQQRDAVRYPESAFIEACPGSGKTRTLTAKLLHILEEVRNTPRIVACITYTNAAAHEIENRVRSQERNSSAQHYEVSTIHSFCLNHIIGPYHWKMSSYMGGFEVLPSDSEMFQGLAESICKRHDICYDYNTKEAFERLGRNTDGSPILPNALDGKVDTVLEFWNELEKQGYMDFSTIIYGSYELVSTYPKIARSVASKCAWILIDEFQDTTELQLEVLKAIADFRITKFFLVGDPKQSIYGFTGARPDLMYEFADGVFANADFALSENWRSSTQIVGKAETLLPRTPPMMAVGRQRDFDFVPYHSHRSSMYSGITEDFLPLLREHGISYGNAAILAPSWFTLYNVGRKLAKDGIPVIGPGARPYRRSNYMFARFAEKICEYIESRETHLIEILERELFILIRDLTGYEDHSILSYRGRKIVLQIIKDLSQDMVPDEFAQTWLTSIAGSVTLLLETEEVITPSQGTLLKQSANDLVSEIRARSETALTVRELAIFASYSKNLKAFNIPRSKGIGVRCCRTN